MRIVLCLLAALLLTSSLPAGIAFGQIPPNVKLNTDGTLYLQNEEQIWINLADSMNVVADWRDWRLGYRRIGVGVSTDGGATWSDGLVTGVYDRQSDPCMVGDPSGVFYLNMLDYQNAGPESQISVMRSTDGGQIWLSPVAVAPLGPYFEDKQFTALDRTGGAHAGNYYVSWTRFDNPTRILFARSTDGALSFDDTVTVGPVVTSSCGTFDQGQFSIPIVNSDGSVHVFWQGMDLDSNTCVGLWAIRHAYSTDGGATFTKDTVAYHHSFGYSYADGSINVYGMPNGDADISGGPYDGTIYIAQTHYPPDYSQLDVVVRKSTDNGITWSEPNTVNDDPPGGNIDQFHPWLIVNEDGTVVMIFYDQRNDPVGHYLFDCYFSASFDGGETFIHNYRLSSVSSSPSYLASVQAKQPFENILDPTDYPVTPSVTASPMAGLIAEYIGVHAKHDYVVAVWTDTRDFNQDAYSTRFTIPFMPPRLYLPADGSVQLNPEAAFRWSTCWHESEDSYRLEISTDPSFATVDYTYAGLTDNNYNSAVPFPAGHYYWRVKAFRSAGDSTAYSETFDVTLGCSVAAAPVLTAPAQDAVFDTTSVQLTWDPVGDALSYHLQMSTTPDFSALVVDLTLGGTTYTANGLLDSTAYYWRVNAANTCGTGDWSERRFRIELCPVTMTGDVNVTGDITTADIIYLVGYVFKGGPAPLPVEGAGDVQCDGTVTSSDIIYLVNYVFKSGPPPCDVCSIL